MTHTITELSNGLRVVTREMPSMESVSLGLWVGAGARCEAQSLNGISHFLEHILFKGTRTRTARQISQAIESVGGSLNGFTGEEYTCYIAKVPHRHLKLATNVLLDMYLSPSLRDDDIQREKTVIREEISMALDTPQVHVFDLLNSVLWENHPLGRPLIGTAETVSALTKTALRDYRNKHYTLPNTVFASAGRVTHADMQEVLRQILPARGAPVPAPRYIPARALQRRPAFHLHRKETEQIHLCLGIRGYRRDHRDRYALQLLSIVLGENMSSRLFQQIREKHGLAYAIHSAVIRYKDTGALSIYAGVENKKFLKALSLILDEVAGLRDGGVRAAELARAKEYWIGQLSMEMEKTTQNMINLGENLLCSGRVLTREETLSNIAMVRPEDVRRVAEEILVDAGLNLAVVGPVQERDEDVGERLHV
jgi:predicted Zn-dependent peptidase